MDGRTDERVLCRISHWGSRRDYPIDLRKPRGVDIMTGTLALIGFFGIAMWVIAGIGITNHN